jgi:hypothetical protein
MTLAVIDFEHRREFRAPDLNRRTALYRHFNDADELLYVGVSFSPGSRTKDHRGEAEWMGEAVRFTGVWYPTRTEALAAETEAIKREGPLFNRDHSRNRPSGPRRKSRGAAQMLSFRVDKEDYDAIKVAADGVGLDVSHMVRRMLAYASANMPEGWVPPRRDG